MHLLNGSVGGRLPEGGGPEKGSAKGGPISGSRIIKRSGEIKPWERGIRVVIEVRNPSS